jgi:hypothetical protein
MLTFVAPCPQLAGSHPDPAFPVHCVLLLVVSTLARLALRIHRRWG